MALYRTMVVGTDGSSSATEALLHAGELAKVSGTEKIHIVMASKRVERAEVQMAMADIPADLDAHPDLYASDRYVLARATEMLEPTGIPTETHLIADSAADALIYVAEQQEADLIVVGNRGLGAGKRLFLGSVSNKLVQHAHNICAVLVYSCDD